jgi:hypothetical protein
MRRGVARDFWQCFADQLRQCHVFVGKPVCATENVVVYLQARGYLYRTMTRACASDRPDRCNFIFRWRIFFKTKSAFKHRDGGMTRFSILDFRNAVTLCTDIGRKRINSADLKLIEIGY